MSGTLRLEISRAGPDEWRVVERSNLATEGVYRRPFVKRELDALLAKIGQNLTAASLDDAELRRGLRRLGGRLAEIVLPESIREKIRITATPVEFFLDDESVCLPVELFPHGEMVLAEATPVIRHWLCENATPPRRQPAASMEQALIVADPAGDLPAAQAEGEALLRMMRGRWKCRFLGRSVDVGQVGREFSDTAVLHLAAHYYVGTNNESSGVKMIDGAWLPFETGRVPELVFANCCRAGLTGNDNVVGDGGLSLAGRFLQNGSTQVIAPYLPVPDAVAKEFALAFYSAYLADGDAATAVWRARCAVGPVGWSYWHFGAASLPAEVPKRSGGKQALLVVALAAIIMAAVVYWWLWKGDKTPIPLHTTNTRITSAVDGNF